eukprot:gene9618-14933_t
MSYEAEARGLGSRRSTMTTMKTSTPGSTTLSYQGSSFHVPVLSLNRGSSATNKAPPTWREGIPRNASGTDGFRVSSSTPGNMGVRSRSGLIRRHLEKLEGEDRVRAMVRVRPFLPHESEAAARSRTPLTSCVRCEAGNVYIADAQGKEHAFQLDHGFSAESRTNPDAAQRSVFEVAGRPVVETALSGYNGCILAYGQTNTGKTYTMLGPEPSGIIPRVVSHLFQSIDGGTPHAPPPPVLRKAGSAHAMLDPEHTSPYLSPMMSPGSGPSHVNAGGSFNAFGKCYEVTCAFMEIYTEKVRDLLLGSEEFQDLRVRNHPSSGPYVEGLTQLPATSQSQILQMIERGSRERTVAATAANNRSSRSHAIFQITVTQTEMLDALASQGIDSGTPVSEATVSRINLVDLAGSERYSTAKSAAAAEESSSINLSLTTLRRVIDCLMDKNRSGKQKIPPYRESTLTWLLSESLGGNSKTVVIGTVSPHIEQVDETINTLRYLSKAKGIVNVVSKNEDKHAALIKALKQEVTSLQARVAEHEGGTHTPRAMVSIGDTSVGSFHAGSVTPCEIEEGMDKESLRKQLLLRNRIIEELKEQTLFSSDGVVGSIAPPKHNRRQSSSTLTMDKAIQVYDQPVAANVVLRVPFIMDPEEAFRGKKAIIAAAGDALGLPPEVFVDFSVEESTADERKQAKRRSRKLSQDSSKTSPYHSFTIHSNTNGSNAAGEIITVVMTATSTSAKLPTTDETAISRALESRGYRVPGPVKLNINSLSLTAVESADELAALSMSPRGLQQQLLAEQRSQHVLQKKIAALQGKVDSLTRAEAAQTGVFDGLRDEMSGLVDVIREKNEANLKLSLEADGLRAEKEGLLREVRRLRDRVSDVTEEKENIEEKLRGADDAQEEWGRRSRSLEKILQDKVLVVERLQEELRTLADSNIELAKKADGPARHASEAILQTISSIRSRTGSTASFLSAEARNNSEANASAAHNNTSNGARKHGESVEDPLVTANELLATRLGTEKELRMQLGEDRRKLLIDCDQLRVQHNAVLNLLAQRGLVVVGSAPNQRLMKAARHERKQRSRSLSLPRKSVTAARAESLRAPNSIFHSNPSSTIFSLQRSAQRGSSGSHTRLSASSSIIDQRVDQRGRSPRSSMGFDYRIPDYSPTIVSSSVGHSPFIK